MLLVAQLFTKSVLLFDNKIILFASFHMNMENNAKIFYVYIGASSWKKNQKLDILIIGKMTTQGDPWEEKGPKNAKIKSIEFRAELPMFFTYILVAYEEQLIKSSKFDIRKFSRVRVPFGVYGSFFHPSKITLRSNGPRSFFMGSSLGHPLCTCTISTRQTLHFRL